MTPSRVFRALAVALCSLPALTLHAQSIGLSINLTASLQQAYIGQPVTLTATVVASSGPISATNGLPVIFETPDGVAGTVPLENGTASIQVFPFLSHTHGTDDNWVAVINNTPVFEGSVGMITVVDLGPGPGVAALQGNYALQFNGTTNVPALSHANRVVGLGSLSFRGGSVMGELDYNTAAGTLLHVSVGGSYFLDSTGAGLLTLEDSSRNVEHFSLYAKAPASGAAAGTASMLQIDGNVLFGSATLKQQTATDAGGAVASAQGAYALNAWGETAAAGSVAAGPIFAAGQLNFTSSGTGAAIAGPVDITSNSSLLRNIPLSGSATAPDSSGRFTFTLSAPNELSAVPTNFVAYVIDATHVYFLATDSHAQYALLSGDLAQ